jgi:hypothetical protein
MLATVVGSSLLGTWKLVSRIDVGLDGEQRIDPILGANPVAFLMYDATGHFAVQFMRRDRDASAQGSAPSSVSTSNNSGAVNGYDAYFGRYSVGNDGTVTQELLGALSPADVGKVVTRSFRINGAELVIELRTTASDGEPVTRTLRWERVA